MKITIINNKKAIEEYMRADAFGSDDPAVAMTGSPLGSLPHEGDYTFGKWRVVTKPWGDTSVLEENPRWPGHYNSLGYLHNLPEGEYTLEELIKKATEA